MINWETNHNNINSTCLWNFWALPPLFFNHYYLPKLAESVIREYNYMNIKIVIIFGTWIYSL